jgi:DNA-binding NtrC family response regulator
MTMVIGMSVDSTPTRVLVASSSAAFRQQLLAGLSPVPSFAEQATGGADALMKLDGAIFRTLYLDCRLTDLNFQEVLRTIERRHPEVFVVRVDSKATPSAEPSVVAHGEDAITAGAALVGTPGVVDSSDSGAVPVTNDPGANIGEDLAPAGRSLEHEKKRTEPLPGMIGGSVRMVQVYRLSRLVAPRDTSVLIEGESGTGKELVARGIHDLSARAQRPFVVVNCAAIPESLLESELFGYTRGAFTGAFQSQLGRIHAAHGGTLFLDEIGDMPMNMQSKLLRFVQQGEVQRLGSPDLFRVDVRLIAATNTKLLQRVKENQFREDLYYRLHVFPIDVPSLRERVEDILPLAERFLGLLCQDTQSAPKEITKAANAILEHYSWPGNVRELKHLMERAFVLSEDDPRITPELLSLPMQTA